MTDPPSEEPKEQRANETTLHEDALRCRRATTEHGNRHSYELRNQKETKLFFNTAYDPDENGHELDYQKAKDGSDSEIFEKAAGKESIKLIPSKNGRWVR